jgi:hypothetical protein
MISTMRFVLVGASLVHGVHGTDLSMMETGVRRAVKSDLVEVVPSGPIKRQSVGEDDAASPDDLEKRVEAPEVTVFPVRHLAKADATTHVASPPSGNQAPSNPASENEIQRLNHALEIKQHELAAKDIVIADATKDIKRLNHALENRQHQMATKDVDVAMGKHEVSRLNHALGIRQKIFVEKDMSMAAEKNEEARLQAEIDALNTELTMKLHYVYYLATALLLAATLLLAVVAFITLDRRNALPAWLAASAPSKQKAVAQVLDKHVLDKNVQSDQKTNEQ